MLVEKLKLTNLLSFGPLSETFQLGRLNLLIGANGSGKSNFIEALELLRQAPEQLGLAIREGGGIRDWLWKDKSNRQPTATIDAVVAGANGGASIRYVLSIAESAQRFEIVEERIETAAPYPGHTQPYIYYALQNGQPVLNMRSGGRRSLRREEVDVSRSILAQLRDPEVYPEITHFSKVFPEIRLYREWGFGRYTTPRLPQKADLPNDKLESDCSNLGLVLNRLRRDAAVRGRLIDALRKLYDGIDDFDVQVEGGTVQVFFHEDGITVPATRLSDGTLRYLCLLAILCHPNPPPLVCIEEPELGLHPDVIPTLAELIREASERCQLIVTTHSDILVDAMTDIPEAVVVCEKVDGATQLRRLSPVDLELWLKNYRLGELWTRGELGGTRW